MIISQNKMFSPNPKKSLAPVFLGPGFRLQVFFKKSKDSSSGLVFEKDPSTSVYPGGLVTVEVEGVSVVRWKSSNGEVQMAYNHDIKTGLPEKYFADDSGLFELNSGIESVSFTNDASKVKKSTVVSIEFM